MTTRQDGIGDRGLAEDLEGLAERDVGGAADQEALVGVGRLVLEAEALKQAGQLTQERFGALRKQALALLAGAPAHVAAELLAPLDALSPGRRA